MKSLGIFCVLFLFIGMVQGETRVMETRPASSISVTGVGKITVAPDVAHLSLSISTIDAKSSAVAMKKNRDISSKVLETLKRKVDKEDLQTVAFEVAPKFEFINKNGVSENKFLGYAVVHSLNVSIKKMDEIGVILDSLIQEDNDEVSSVRLNGIVYGLCDRSVLESKARVLAITNAKLKAMELLEPLGYIPGAPLNIGESMNYERRVYNRSAMADAAPGGNTEIETGQISVSVTVSASFEISTKFIKHLDGPVAP